MRKIYFKQLLTTIVALLCSVAVGAHDFEVGGIFYEITGSSNLKVTYKGLYSDSYLNEYQGTVVIPESVTYNEKTYSVTSIGDNAFYYCVNLTSITIPNSVTSIGNYAFRNCSKLTSVTIPNSVTSIGDRAFESCVSLKELRIEDGKTTLSLGHNSYYTEYRGLFYDCPLQSLYLGRDISYKTAYNYGYSPFYNKEELKLLTIGNGVTSIGDRAFSGCSGLTSVTIPNSVTSIGNYAFYECSGLTSIEIPNSVTSIGGSAFGSCSGLTSVTIPNSVTSIGGSAFGSCSRLTSVVVESGNRVYDSRDNCNAIIKTSTNALIQGCNNTIIPNSVTSIGDYAFYGCSGLIHITIPQSVASIGEDAFCYCSSLVNIVSNIPAESLFELPGTALTVDGKYGPFKYIDEECSLIVPAGAKATYASNYGWRVFKRIVENTTDNLCGDNTYWTYDEATATHSIIGWGTMYDYAWDNVPWTKFKEGVKTVVIEDGVTSIGSSAFSGYSGLTCVTIGNSVTSIRDNAFFGCSSLTSVISNIPADKIFAVDASVFEGVDKSNCILYVPAGAKATYVATAGWKNFTNIVEMATENLCGYNLYCTYDEATATLGIIGTGRMYDFEFRSAPWRKYSQNIKTVVIGDGVTGIGSMPFSGCSSLTSVISNIPAGKLFAVLDYVFEDYSGGNIYNCTLYVPAGTKATYAATAGWKEFANIVEMAGEKLCGDNAYWSFDEETATLTISGSGAMHDFEFSIAPWLEYQEDIKTVVIEDGVTSIGSSAFSGCSGLTSVTIPNSVTSIGEGAFYNCSSLTSVTIGNSVTSIGKWAFRYCKALTGVEIPSSVTFIGAAAFEYSGIVNIAFPESITNIDEWMFNGCIGLTNVTIPNSVTSIGEVAFYNCTGLTSVTIPNRVTNIGNYAFSGCSCLTSIYLLSETPASISGYSFSNYGATLYVPQGSIEAYRVANYWSNFTNIVEFDPTGIEDVADDVPAFEITTGGIQLTAAEGKALAIYTAGGALVEKIDSYAGDEIILDKGLYIVRVGNKTMKVKL